MSPDADAPALVSPDADAPALVSARDGALGSVGARDGALAFVSARDGALAVGAFAVSAWVLWRLAPVLESAPVVERAALVVPFVGLLWGVALTLPRISSLLSRGGRWLRAACDGIALVDREVLGAGLRALPLSVLGAVAGIAARAGRRVRLGTAALLATAFGFWLVAPHPGIASVERPEPEALRLTAEAGPGYAYLWDFDSDGTADTAWLPDREVEARFGEERLAPGVFVVLEPGAYGRPVVRLRLAPGERMKLNVADLGAAWHARGDGSRLPAVTATEHGVRVRLNDARGRLGRQLVAPDQQVVELGRGESIAFGTAKLSVTGVAAPTLFVRNAWGLVRSHRPSYELPRVDQRTMGTIGGTVSEGKGALR